MIKCGWNKCDVQFDETEIHPGHSRKYCCNKHRQAASWERHDEKVFQERLDLRKKREAARIYAAINCVNYTDCICSVKVVCLDCDKADIKLNAYQHEPGVLVHDQDEEHGLNIR